MAKYELTLCQKDFLELANKFDMLSKRIPQLEQKVLNELAEYTRERMIYYVKSSVNSTFSTGNLANNIIIEQITKSHIKVKVDENKVPYAVYVEYGTGIVGAGTHPNYGGSYKEEGWWYPTNANDPNPHKKQLENGDWIAYTEGQVAHKYVYNAYQDLRQNYKQIVLKILKEEGYI